MAYRDDLTALGARHEALATEVATKTRELDDARRLFDEAHARSKLPILPNIRIATPCSAEWAKMSGDDRIRACGACNKNVYNLSGMTRDEAEALIIAKAGDLCVRYFQRSDGTIILKDCEVGISQRRGRRLIAAGAAALLAGAGGLIAHEAGRGGHSATAYAPTAIAPPPETVAIMGGSAFSAPPPTLPTLHVDTPPEPLHELKGKFSIQPIQATMGAVRINPPPPVHDEPRK